MRQGPYVGLTPATNGFPMRDASFPRQEGEYEVPYLPTNLGIEQRGQVSIGGEGEKIAILVTPWPGGFKRVCSFLMV